MFRLARQKIGQVFLAVGEGDTGKKLGKTETILSHNPVAPVFIFLSEDIQLLSTTARSPSSPPAKKIVADNPTHAWLFQC